jgi:hypothetical protein
VHPTDRSTAAESRYGFYSVPRDCVCGEKHLDRETYWKHRIEAESAAERRASELEDVQAQKGTGS